MMKRITSIKSTVWKLYRSVIQWRYFTFTKVGPVLCTSDQTTVETGQCPSRCL